MSREENVLVLRDFEVARGIPVQMALDLVGPQRAQAQDCKHCQGELEETLITTWGTPLWERWPLAVDGWLCRACSNLQLPRFLEAEEIQELTDRGARAATEGDFPEAELHFRRVANSWPRYAPGRLNLARAMQSWLLQEERGAADFDLLERLAAEVERQLRDALQADALPSRLHPLSGLITVLLRREDVGTAMGFLEDELKRPDAPRRELEELRQWVLGRGDLYQRGVDLVERFLPLHDRPAPVLSEGDRRRVEQGVELLQRHLVACPDNWAAMWMAGKACQALDRHQAAAELFRRSLEVKPDQPDVARECGLALLRLGAFEEAVRVTERGCQAAPDDSGLVANLALAQLLAGDPQAALASARQACQMDAGDTVNQNVLELVRAVHEGRRQPPSSAEELGI